MKVRNPGGPLLALTLLVLTTGAAGTTRAQEAQDAQEAQNAQETSEDQSPTANAAEGQGGAATSEPGPANAESSPAPSAVPPPGQSAQAERPSAREPARPVPPVANAMGPVRIGEMEFFLGGYYQTRFKSFFSFFDDSGAVTDTRNPSVLLHRLKLEPTFRIGDAASLSLDLDGFRGVLWGDNAGLVSTPLFASNPSNTLVSGAEVDSIALRRAWMEFKVPVGLVRIGRMPNHWGMGILANDGNGFDDLFGDNEGGTTFDRALFATRPLAIVQKLLGQEDSNFPLIVAVAYDHLVDDPLTTYYGDCRAGLQASDAGFRARCDADGDGVTDDLPPTDESRTAASRDDRFWADSRDDVYEWVYVILYRGKDIELFGEKGDLTAGSYVANRLQGETDSGVWIADAYAKADFFGAHLEFEYVRIAGNTRALVIPNPDVADDPYLREADITGAVGRAGYDIGPLGIWLESGLASGDGNVFDRRFTGRALHPDFNVGLLLYDEILARVSSYNSLSQALGSQGGVYNSRYLYPNLRWRFHDDWQMVAAFLMAWPDAADGDSIRCSAEDASERCKEFVARASPDEVATASHLGWEADLAIKGTFARHMRVSLEGALAQVTDRVPVARAGLAIEPFYYSLQLRLAYDFGL